jgi:hypothetical protein
MDERYLRIIGGTGFESRPCYTGYYYCAEGGYWDTAQGSKLLGLVVSDTWPCSDADKQLKRHDVITKVNGMPVDFSDDGPLKSQGSFAAGRTYRLTVMRYRDTEKIGARGQLLPLEDPHEIIEVDVVAETKSIDSLLPSEEEKLRELASRAWAGFQAECQHRRNSLPSGGPAPSASVPWQPLPGKP